MPDSPTIRELWERHRRSLYLLLRSLLPAAGEADAAWRETLIRIAQRSPKAPADNTSRWVNRIAIEVAAERRRAAITPGFSDDLCRQLAESAEPSLEVAADRPRAIKEVLDRLPASETALLRRKHGAGLSIEQIANADGRTPTAIARDLGILHSTLASALHEAIRRDGPEPPGGASDLGRLTQQLLDGTISGDSCIVLETLLLADLPAQAHYHRHVALAVELEWAFRGQPPLPQLPEPDAPRVSAREWAVTIAFIAACVAAALFVILLFTGQLRRLF